MFSLSLISIYLFSTLVAYFLPKTFLVIYLLGFTGGLGFIHPDRLLPLSFENIIFILNLATVLPIIFRLGFKFIFSEMIVRVFLIFFLFGIFYPILNGWSNIFSSITDGKGFLSILMVPYLLSHNAITPKFLKTCIFGISTYLGLTCFFYLLFNIYPNGYEPISSLYNQIATGEGIHIRYSTIILVAVLIAYIDLREKYSQIRLVSFLIQYAFLFIQPHNSVLLASIVVLGLHFLYNSRLTLKQSAFDLAIIFSGFMVSILFIFVPVIRMGVLSIFYQIFYLQGSIGSRITTNAFRWDLFSERPILGYGFIDETSALGAPVKSAAISRFTQTFGVIDAGIIDILIRFGLIGFLAWVVALFLAIRGSGKDFLIFKLLLAAYFLTSFTWSVFTYSFGILVMSIVFALCVKNQKLKLKKELNNF